MATILEIQKFASSQAQQVALVLAQEQITALRRLYAHATDALGKTEDANAQRNGLSIYHQIFTTDATIRVSGATAKALQGIGPDAWADVARNALLPYVATQHLIGSQLVQFNDIEWAVGGGDQAQIEKGSASMKSYLQAWHAWPNDRLRLVMGTYHDDVVYTTEQGWQICSMNLEHVSGEERQLGD